jgi:bacterioferritin-associated ferredoxin
MNGNTIICACNGTTAAQIKKAVEEGACTYQEVQAKLHIGVQCIKCKDLAEILIDSFMETE